MNDMKKMQKARAEALEAALGALSAGVGRDAAWTAEPEEVLAYAKFILGKRPAKKKRRRTKVQGGERRAYVAKQGTPLPRTEDELKGWTPLGYMTEDGLKEDPSFSVADVFRSKSRAETAPQPPTLSALDLDRAVRDLREKVARGDLAAEPAPVKAADGIDLRPVGEDPGDRGILTQWAEAIRQQDAAREAAREARDLEVEFEDGKDPEVVKLTPLSTPEEKRKAEERLGLVAGALDEDLTFSSVDGFRFPDGRPAEKARAEAKEPETSLNAPGHVVTQGASLGCPECSAEAERREKRDEALGRGREKLRDRLTTMEQRNTDQVEPLDEDELLAVAGSEVYPPNDEEPSQELKIRNRKGEVRTWRSGGAQEGHGWTSSPEDPWGLRYAWTSLEMSRRGPWHVV